MIGHQEAGYVGSWDMKGSGSGGGAIHEWTRGQPRYWVRIQIPLNQYPQTTDIYSMLCVRDPMTGDPNPTQADFEVVEAIAAQLANRAPGVTVWASATSDFDRVVCPITGTTDPAISGTWADYVAELGFAARGPEVSPLTQATVSPDDCHPNQDGRLMWGEEPHTVFFEGCTIGGRDGGPGFDGALSDDDGNVHEPNIEILAAQDFTDDNGATHEPQMASFLARSLALLS